MLLPDQQHECNRPPNTVEKRHTKNTRMIALLNFRTFMISRTRSDKHTYAHTSHETRVKTSGEIYCFHRLRSAGAPTADIETTVFLISARTLADTTAAYYSRRGACSHAHNSKNVDTT